MPKQFPLDSLARALTSFLTAIAVVSLIILAGEVIAEGGSQTLWWLQQRTASFGVTLAYVLLLFLTLRLLLSFWASTYVLGLAVALFSYANKLKLLKLGVPVSPFDLALSHQYFSVARILWGEGALWALYLLFASLLAAVICYRHAIGRWIRSRGMNWLGAGGCALVASALIYLPDFSGQSTNDYRSTVPKLLAGMSVVNLNWVPNQNLKLNGQLLTFFFNVRIAFVEPPADYSRDSVVQGLRKIAKPRAPAGSIQKATDIVVIMNEAFWDPSRLPGVRFSDRLLGKLQSTARGQVFSPVFGGYTANTEFEFLTRLSMAYLPSGAIPYTQFIHRPLPSLATALRSAGYSATAVHPFERTFYQRDRVYRELGFERFIALDEFVAPERAGPFVKDASVAREIATLIDASPERKHFVFAVTMQNHGPYTDGSRYPEGSRVPLAVDGVSLSAQSADALQSYATGVRDGVDLFNQVVRYFEERKRNAVVLLFGDHLPGLGDRFGVYRETGFVTSSAPDRWSSGETERMHSVPVVGWTNFGDGLRLAQSAISPIYLSTFIKRAAGVEDDPMDRLLDHMRTEHDVLTKFYSRNGNGTSTQGVPADTEMTRLYRHIQYDLLFGSQYAAPVLLEAPDDSAD